MSSTGVNDAVLCALLTVEDVAALLQVSPRTVWRMRSSCQIPKPIKVGGGVRWRRQDIESWIAQGCPNQAIRRR